MQKAALVNMRVTQNAAGAHASKLSDTNHLSALDGLGRQEVGTASHPLSSV